MNLRIANVGQPSSGPHRSCICTFCAPAMVTVCLSILLRFLRIMNPVYKWSVVSDQWSVSLPTTEHSFMPFWPAIFKILTVDGFLEVYALDVRQRQQPCEDIGKFLLLVGKIV